MHSLPETYLEVRPKTFGPQILQAFDRSLKTRRQVRNPDWPAMHVVFNSHAVISIWWLALRHLLLHSNCLILIISMHDPSHSSIFNISRPMQYDLGQALCIGGYRYFCECQWYARRYMS
jgi:hypothetical protein